jgi:hypothetical protein
MSYSWEFHVDDRSESSRTYGMIIATNQDFDYHTVTWDTDTIPMKDRDTALYHQ